MFARERVRVREREREREIEQACLLLRRKIDNIMMTSKLRRQPQIDSSLNKIKLTGARAKTMSKLF